MKPVIVREASLKPQQTKAMNN